MKSLVILLALLACLVRCDELARLASLEEKLRDIFNEKCNNNANSIFASLELLIATNRLEECIPAFAFDVTANPTEALQEFCRIVKLRGYKRVKTFVKRLIPCLEEEEQFMADLITSGFNATFEHVCGESDNVLNVTEIIGSFVNGSCSNNTAQLANTLSTNCLENLKITETFKSDKFIFRQNDVCSDITSVKNCVETSLQVHCGYSHSQILNTIFEPYINWCVQNGPKNEADLE